MAKLLRALAALSAVAAIGAAHASLVDLGDGTVKDTETNLIWLQDWNVNGLQDWATQKAWAEGLSFAGSSDWVLPTVDNYSILFNEVGNLTFVSAFTNVVSYFYWSSTEQTPGMSAWFFAPNTRGQGAGYETTQYHAVAVRPADVAPVPEPSSYALVLAGLAALAFAAKRRKMDGDQLASPSNWVSGQTDSRRVS